MFNRRDALRLLVAVGGLSASGAHADAPRPDTRLAAADEPPRAKPAEKGMVHLVVFSNFEGQSRIPGPVIQWFDACSAAHPEIRWTHMYSPAYLVPGSPKIDSPFTPYLLEAQAKGRAEIGLHLHMFYDLVQQMGVTPRGYPYAGDKTPDCNDPRDVKDDRLAGYDVLMTGYSAEERSKLLDVSIDSFVSNGFARPKSFCAGYSAADPELQKMLAEKGIEVSFSAQVIPPDYYGSCWDRLLKWSGNITPLSIPYRVSQNSILPPPHRDDKYLNLVEFPLNMGVDVHDIYLQKTKVTRTQMFDRHFDWVGRTGKQTAVAIGVHAEVIAGETWGQGPVSAVIDTFLKHVKARSKENRAEIRFGTVSEIAKVFYENKHLGGVPADGPPK